MFIIPTHIKPYQSIRRDSYRRFILNRVVHCPAAVAPAAATATAAAAAAAITANAATLETTARAAARIGEGASAAAATTGGPTANAVSMVSYN